MDSFTFGKAYEVCVFISGGDFALLLFFKGYGIISTKRSEMLGRGVVGILPVSESSWWV